MRESWLSASRAFKGDGKSPDYLYTGTYDWQGVKALLCAATENVLVTRHESVQCRKALTHLRYTLVAAFHGSRLLKRPQQLLQLSASRFSRTSSVADQQVLGVSDELAAGRDVYGRLLLVSCDHPHLQGSGYV